MAFLFQAFGVLEHWAANVVADIGELVRFAELHDVIPIEKSRRAAVKRFEKGGVHARLAGKRSQLIYVSPPP